MTVQENVEKAMNPETFDVLAYVDDQPVAEETVDVYVNVAKARELEKLMEDRAVAVAKKRSDKITGEAPIMGLGDEDEDTIYDNQINALLEDLEKTKLVFHIRSVAPALVRAIDKKYLAKMDKDWDEERLNKHEADRLMEIVSHSITKVVTGDGAVDETKWDRKRLAALEEKLYRPQFERLTSELLDMVYTGEVFERVLNADFS